MLVKTFRAGDMTEALKKVKAELGADAMIISSKKERKKGILGIFSKPYFEVTAALDPKPVHRPAPNPYREKEVLEPTAREEFQNSMLGPLARELKELRERVEQLAVREQSPSKPPVSLEPAQETEATAPEEATLPPAKKGNGADGPLRTFSKEELDDIKQYLFAALSAKKGEAVPVVFPVQSSADVVTVEDEQPEVKTLLEEVTADLTASGLGDEALKRITEYVKPAIEQGEDREGLRYTLVEAFAHVVACSGPLRLKKNTQRVVALVGPTGVGKTTTTAKLAAMYAMNKGATVALITTDNFRVGAVEQLKTYSRIMDLPLEVVTSSDEMQASLAKHADKDLVIIDTAGRSPKDQGKLSELKRIFEADPSIEVHLCLSSTTKDQELMDIVKRFSLLPISRLLFTKLDESESLGCIVNTHITTGLPLSYFTNGQMVPEDISMASARKLANLVLKAKSITE
jgi:flagellar biosynthesis protein FlhF